MFEQHSVLNLALRRMPEVSFWLMELCGGWWWGFPTCWVKGCEMWREHTLILPNPQKIEVSNHTALTTLCLCVCVLLFIYLTAETFKMRVHRLSASLCFKEVYNGGGEMLKRLNNFLKCGLLISVWRNSDGVKFATQKTSYSKNNFPSKATNLK